jgi:hypothetical protein
MPLIQFAVNFPLMADSAARRPEMRMHPFETIALPISKLRVHHGSEFARAA